MSSKPSHSTHIAKSAGIIGFAVMISRVLGLVREQVFAALFGAGYAYDAFVVAFRIPNLLRDLFGEGALSAAFVTVFSQYDEKYDASKTWKLASNVLSFLTVTISVLVLLAIFFSEEIVHILATDFHLIDGKVELTSFLTKIMLPFLLFISLSAVIMGILNTKGKFFIPALASSFFNLGSIIGGVFFTYLLGRNGYEPIIGMAIGTLIGGILQMTIQLPSLFATGFTFRPHIHLNDPGLRKILKLMIPATVGLSAVQINIFINTNFAASCMEGSVSWLNYAFRLVMLPIGMFGVALSIAVMPLLGRLSANKDIQGLRNTLSSSLSMVFTLTIPASLGLWLLSTPIVSMLFERGAFSASDTTATAQLLSLYAIGLFAYSANKILVPAFYAIDKPSLPVIASFITIFLNIAFITLTIDKLQHHSIALSTSLTMLFNFTFLFTMLYKELNGFPVGYLLKSLLKIVIASASMAALILFCTRYIPAFFHGTTIQLIFGLGITITACVIVYGVLLYLLKLEELNQIISALKKRLGIN